MDLATIVLGCIPLFAGIVVVTDDIRMQQVMKKK